MPASQDYASAHLDGLPPHGANRISETAHKETHRYYEVLLQNGRDRQGKLLSRFHSLLHSKLSPSTAYLVWV